MANFERLENSWVGHVAMQNPFGYFYLKALSSYLTREKVYIFRRIKIGKEFLFIHGKNLEWSTVGVPIQQ